MAERQDWLDTTDPTLRRVERKGEVTPTNAVACCVEREDGTRCNAPANLVNGHLVCPAHSKGRKREHVGPVGKVTTRDPRSRVLPRRLLEKYEEVLKDPELLSHRADVALLEARLLELTERLSDGESGQLWRDLRKALADWDRAGEDERDLIMKSVRVLVEKGAGDEEIWRQLHFVIQQKTAVSSAEFKRLVDMKQVLTAEKAIAFAATVLEIVERNTPEEARRKKIAREIQQLMLVGSE